MSERIYKFTELPHDAEVICSGGPYDGEAYLNRHIHRGPRHSPHLIVVERNNYTLTGEQDREGRWKMNWVGKVVKSDG